jgi:hypothetical protein
LEKMGDLKSGLKLKQFENISRHDIDKIRGAC